MPIRTQQAKAALWGTNLVLAAAVVFFLVRAAQHMFVSAVAPEPVPRPLADSPLSNSGQMSSKIRPLSEYASLKASNLFGALSSSNVAAKKVKVIEEKLPETTLELELLGCVAASVPEFSFAIIRNKKSRTEDTYTVGDFIVSGAMVEEIRESEVVISRAGRREVLAMSFADMSPPASIPRGPRGGRRSSARAPARSSSGGSGAIRVVNDNLRYINREMLVEEVTQSMGQLMNEFNASPNVVDGKPAGVQLDALGSHPVISQLGLRPGDIVKSINGIRVNSSDEAFALYERLKNSPEIRVVVERDGRHRTLVYKVR